MLEVQPPPSKGPAEAPPPDPSLALQSWVLFLGGLLVAGFLFAWTRDTIGWDQSCYARLISHLKAGRFDLAVNGYWSPLIAWLGLPLTYLGLAEVEAIRAVTLLTSVFQACLALRLGHCMGLRGSFRFLAGVLVLIRGLRDGVDYASPDMLFSCLILAYLLLLIEEDSTWDGSLPYGIGVVVGFAYFAKAFALPFGICHYFVFLLAQSFWGGLSGKKATFAYLKFLLVLGLLVGPWIGLLTQKYGRPTFSTAGGINFRITGPDWPYSLHPYQFRLYALDEHRLHAFEDPPAKIYPNWNPLNSSQEAIHFVRNLIIGLWGIRLTHDWYDPFHARSLFLFLLLPWIALAGPREVRGLARFSWATMAFFHAAYLPVVSLPPRYHFVAIHWLTLWVIWGLQRISEEVPEGRSRSGFRAWALAFPFLAYSAPSWYSAYLYGEKVTYWKQFTPVIEALAKLPDSRAIASTERDDFRLAFWNELPFTGRPEGRAPDTIAREMDQTGTGWLLVWEGRRHAEGMPKIQDFEASPLFRKIQSFEVRGLGEPKARRPGALFERIAP